MWTHHVTARKFSARNARGRRKRGAFAKLQSLVNFADQIAGQNETAKFRSYPGRLFHQKKKKKKNKGKKKEKKLGNKKQKIKRETRTPPFPGWTCIGTSDGYRFRMHRYSFENASSFKNPAGVGNVCARHTCHGSRVSATGDSCCDNVARAGTFGKLRAIFRIRYNTWKRDRRILEFPIGQLRIVPQKNFVKIER